MEKSFYIHSRELWMELIKDALHQCNVESSKNHVKAVWILEYTSLGFTFMSKHVQCVMACIASVLLSCSLQMGVSILRKILLGLRNRYSHCVSQVNQGQ